MGYSSIKLYGGQVCNYLNIQNSKVNNDDIKNVKSKPQAWSDNTLLLSKFNKNLIAGNSALTESIVGYEIRRRNGSSPYTQYVCTIDSSENDENKKFIIDYGVSSNMDYTYYLYPSSKSGNSSVTLSPVITDEIKTDWSYWSLLVVDDTEEDNVFYLSKLFKFELNLSVGDMNNNAQITVTNNFTKYPTIQYGASNYWSGSLSSLCGFISCNDVDYVQTPNMIDELKQLTSDTRRKFLKDNDGHIWEVKITSPISINTETNVIPQIKTVNISWAEVEDASNASIINNPDTPTVSWLLTQDGEALPYIDYVWDEHYKWDNSYKWTAKDDMHNVDISNMGRDLYSKDGDIE